MSLDLFVNPHVRGASHDEVMNHNVCQEELPSSGHRGASSSQPMQLNTAPWLSSELLNLLDGSRRRHGERDIRCCTCSAGEDDGDVESVHSLISSHTSSFNRSLHGDFFGGDPGGLTPSTTEATPTGYPSCMVGVSEASPTKACPLHSPFFSPPSVVFNYTDVENVLRRGQRTSPRRPTTREVGTSTMPSPTRAGKTVEEDGTSAKNFIQFPRPRSASTPLTAMEAFLLWRSHGMPGTNPPSKSPTLRRRELQERPPHFSLELGTRPIPTTTFTQTSSTSSTSHQDCPHGLSVHSSLPSSITVSDMIMGSFLGSGLDWLLPGHTIFQLLLLACVFFCMSAVYFIVLVILL